MKKPDLLIHVTRDGFTAEEGQQLREQWERRYPAVEVVIIHGQGMDFYNLAWNGNYNAAVPLSPLPVLDGDAVVAYLDNLGWG